MEGISERHRGTDEGKLESEGSNLCGVLEWTSATRSFRADTYVNVMYVQKRTGRYPIHTWLEAGVVRSCQRGNGIPGIPRPAQNMPWDSSIQFYFERPSHSTCECFAGTVTHQICANQLCSHHFQWPPTCNSAIPSRPCLSNAGSWNSIRFSPLLGAE